jgi:RND superfamily putative drug exporter
MFKSLGRFTAAHAWTICAAWLLAAGGLALLAPSWDTRAQDDDIRFLPARCDSVRGYQLLQQAFPQEVSASRVIFTVERSDRPLDSADLDLVDRLAGDLNRLRVDEPELQLGRVYSHQDAFIGKRLLSADKLCTLIQVSLQTPFLALQTRKAVDRTEEVLRRRMAEARPGAPRLLVTGPAGVGRDLTRASADSLHATTLATVVLVLVVLLLVYRAPLLALVPLLTIAVSTWVALNVLALLTLIPGVYLVNVSKVFAIVLLYGAGTDYCLFLISRYREELAIGTELHAAVNRSVTAVGGSLAASAGTVVCGLGLMGFAEFAKVRCAGPAIALSLAVILLASLTLAPALLHLLGRHVFWPLKQRVRPPRRPRLTPWDHISRHVVARPVLIWTAASLVLLPLALYGTSVRPNFKPTGELAPSSDSVRGMDAIQRHFTAGEVGPITVLLVSPTDWNTPQGRDVIAHLSRAFGLLENVAEVRSLTQPLGTPWTTEPARPQSTSRGLLGSLLRSVQQQAGAVRDQLEHTVRDAYVGRLPAAEVGERPRSVARLDVVLRSDPFAPESIETLRLIQVWLQYQLPHSTTALGTVQAECSGVTVNARDMAQVTESDRVRINWLVLGGVFLILLVLVRRPGMAAYLLATVLCTYYATLGATALVGTLVGGRAPGEVDWRVPFFLFTILVAVGEDYNILLIMRALRERKRLGAEGGVRRALARTGGTITSCGLIMAGTFATLMLAGLSTLVQVGFALAFGVLLDTFVVRPFLVPAFAVLVWRREEEPPNRARRQEPLPRPSRRAA